MIWTAIASIATAVAAGFTAWMVNLTKRGLEQNRDHHQDEYRPMLVFVPHHGASPEARIHALQAIPVPPTLRFWGAIRNIGTGPAISGKMKLRVGGLEGYGPDPFDLPPIAAGETYGKAGQHIPVPITHHPHFNETDVRLAPGERWEIELEYEDVFGRIFHTSHTKNPQLPWTTIGRGPAPKGRDPQINAAIMRKVAQAERANADRPISPSEP